MNDKDNKLIALFMGLEEDGVDGYLVDMDKDYGYQVIHESCFLYNSSWDWLMPVVEKMNTTELWEEYDISYLATYLVSTDINATYNAVIEFINEYNKNK